MTSKQFNTEEGQRLYQLENEYRRMREKNGYTRSLAVMGDRIEKLKLKIEKLYPESAETKEFLPSDLSKTGEPIYIKMPPLPDLPEKNVVLKYDQNNFIFNVFEGDKKIGAVNEKQVLQNLNNGEYVIVGKFAEGGFTLTEGVNIGDEGRWRGDDVRVVGLDDIGNAEIVRVNEVGHPTGEPFKISKEALANEWSKYPSGTDEDLVLVMEQSAKENFDLAREYYHKQDYKRQDRALESAQLFEAEALGMQKEKFSKMFAPDVKVITVGKGHEPLSTQLQLITGDGFNMLDYEGDSRFGHVLTHKKTGQKFTVINQSQAELVDMYKEKNSFAHGGVAENEKANEVIARFKDGIKSKADMQLFFSKLHIDLDLIFHPDDNFESYVGIDSNKKIFSKSQAVALDKILDDCFAYCDKHNLDIYEIALDQAKKDGVLPVGIGEEEEAYADGGLTDLALQRDKVGEYRTLRNKGEDEEKIAVIIKHDFRNRRINAVTLWTVLSGNDVVSGAGASKIYSDLGFKPFEGYPLTTKDGQTVFEKGGELTEKKKKEIDKKMIEFMYEDKSFIAAMASRSELIKRKNKLVEQKEELFKKGEHKGIHDKLVAIDDEVDAMETEYLRVSNEIVALLDAEKKKLQKEAGVGEDNIIGQTRSGKSIYDNADSEHHKDFTWEDYDDALDAGDKKMDEAMKEKDNDKITFYFKLKNKFAKGRMNFARADIDEEYGTDKDDQFAKGGSAGEIEIGSVVVYKKPMADEKGLTFTVIEIDKEKNWCMLQANVGMNINPTQTADISELKLAKKFEDGGYNEEFEDVQFKVGDKVIVNTEKLEKANIRWETHSLLHFVNQVAVVTHKTDKDGRIVVKWNDGTEDALPSFLFVKLSKSGKKKDFKKGGDIDSDTEIVSDIAAETVAIDRIGELKDLSVEERVEMSGKLRAHLNKMIGEVYANSERFKKSVNAKGNKGRDNLYMWLNHWTDAYFKENKLGKYAPLIKRSGKKISAKKRRAQLKENIKNLNE